MSLYRRLHGDETSEASKSSSRLAASTRYFELRAEIHEQLIEELGATLFERKVPREEMTVVVRDALNAVISRMNLAMATSERKELIDGLIDDVVGYGPIDVLLRDSAVTDILVNGPKTVYVERGGQMAKSDITFADEKHLRRIVDKIVSEVGRRIDESSPLCDARLPDGSRVNAVIHPLAAGGPYLTIRKFSEERLTINDLINNGTLSVAAAKFLQASILGRLNIIVSGGSGSGKTTTLNVLSSLIPADERIITIEDSKELQLGQDHVLCMESRPANIDGAGEVKIRELVRNSLRMRPDRIIVGECRGAEALDMLQAMNTGHDGSLTTVHSNGAADAVARLETLVLMAGYDLPVKAIRDQLSSAIDLIVQMAKLRDGTRRITQITELQGMDGDDIILQDIFMFDRAMGWDENGRHRGQLKTTGKVPAFLSKMRDIGVPISDDLFMPEAFAIRALMPGEESPTEQDSEESSGTAEEESTQASDNGDSAEGSAVAPEASSPATG